MTFEAEIAATDLPGLKWLIDQGHTEQAAKGLRDYLSDNPADTRGVFLFGRVLQESDNHGLARVVFEWLAQIEPEQLAHWQNLGKSWDHVNEPEKAEACFRKVLELNPDNIVGLTSLGSNLAQQYRSEEVLEISRQTLEIDPSNERAHSNMGFAHLQMREFGKGWDAYEYGVGRLQSRMAKQYCGETYWNGDKGKKLIVYGDQGLGDQIAGMEPIKDLMADNELVAIDCSPKLKNLFARSFGVPVHGDVHKQRRDWHSELEIDASVSAFSVHKHYRRKESDYSGEAFLVADPVRRVGWRAILDSLGDKPKVGIAWSGGCSITQRTARRAPLTELLPILDQDVVWVNLEYRDRSEEIAQLERQRGIKIHDFAWALQSSDYDDTAALVAELDFVVSVPTSVVHLAGGLGVPTACIVHPRPNIHYSREGEQMAYYNSVKMYRRGDEWAGAVRKVADDMQVRFQRKAA